jgi:hypothetical protein
VGIGAKRCEILEEQREIAVRAEQLRREVFDSAVPIQESRCANRADSRNAGIAVGRVSDQREKIGDQRGLHSEFLAHAGRIENLLSPAIDLHDAVFANALREVFVRRPDAHLLHTRILRSDARRGCERIVGLQLDHRPDRDAHRGERLLERMELREEGGLDPIAGFVAGPELVSERLDDMIGRHADVRLSRLDHLQHGLQHADHGAERWILALVEAAQPVEMAEQLIRTVDEVNDHARSSVCIGI